jgi:hypothetical protein
MVKHHGIKVGDLVKFKHHMFDEHQPVWLVTESWSATDANYRTTYYLRIHNDKRSQTSQHLASNFIVISRAYN